MAENILFEEKKRLEETYATVERLLVSVEKRYDALSESRNDIDVLEALAEQYRQEYKNLKRASEKPYFGRIDFKSEDSEETEKLYIGRSGIMENGIISVIDWRTPIASMYYDQRLGEVAYQAPKGIVKGVMSLKRQYTIENKSLISYEDIDIGASDVYLQRSLALSSDIRLKNIIATIQSEQNEIIRKPLDMPLIIQGVAGSGKTTVALHRIAYLVYTYMKKIRPKDFLILAPNPFFLDYISATLPDLGVSDVRQETLEGFVSSFLKNKVTVISKGAEYEFLMQALKEKRYEDCESLKKIFEFQSGLEFKNIIEEYLEAFEESLFNGKNFMVDDIVLISYKVIKQKYFEFSKEISISERISKLKSYILNYLNKIIQDFELGLVTDISTSCIESLKSNMSKLIMQYIKSVKVPNELQFLKSIYSYISKNGKYIEKNIAKKMEKDFSIRLKTKTIVFEELASVLYLHNRIYGIDSKDMPKCIVIDEAQDYGLFHFWVLNNVLRTNAFTILGDLGQGIFSYSGIKSWKILNEEIFDGIASINYLRQSYRTTYEVMSEANKVATVLKKKIDIELAKPIERHGREVIYHKSNTLEDEINGIVEAVKNAKEANLSNIAIITPNLETTLILHETLKKEFADVSVLTNTSEKYNGGIIIVPSYLSKGLEFDAVILSDVDNVNYNISDMNAKLLYVSMTRAMHTLDIFFVKELSNMLKQ